MGASIFRPRRQRAAFQRLVDRGYVTDLTARTHRAGERHVWEFRLGDLELRSADTLDISVDLSKYWFRVVHTRRREPRIYLLAPTLAHKPHTWRDEDDRLCLYRPDYWSWKPDMRFDQDLFPQVCMWAFYTELWLATGKWYGEEAPHH